MPMLLLCLLPVPAHAADEQITLQLKWKHQFQFAGYYAAIEQGYYHEVGLDVHLREAAFGKNPIQAVVNGEAEYGTGTSDLLLSRGQGAPVVVLGVIFQHSPFALIAHSYAAINGIPNLKGKKIMLDPNDAEVVGMLQRGGLPRWSYSRVANSFNLDDWIHHKVDAIDAYVTDQPFDLSRLGIPYRLFKPADYGVDFYGDNFFTTEQEIRDHPQRVRDFREATLKGWAYAMGHPDEIIALLLNKYHVRHSSDKLHYEAKVMMELLGYGTIPTGYMYEGRWQNIARTYQRLGLLTDDFQLAGFLYQPQPQLLDVLWLWRWELLVGMLLVILIIGMGELFTLRRLMKQRMIDLESALLQADASNEEKTRFLASASHDLRQPMQAMTLNIESLMFSLAQPKADPGECIPVIRALKYSHASMRRVLDALLDISKLDAGVVKLDIETVNLDKLIEHITSYLASLAAEKEVKINTSLIPICVTSDLMALESILNNLISNALRYTQPGGKVLIRCRKKKHRVTVDVLDTGIGIPADKLTTVFQEFVQLGNPERDREKGLGLGLSIVNRLVQLLPNHTIDVTSTLGKGSCFRLSMPEAEDWTTASIEMEAFNQELFEGMRVLILEDDDAGRMAMVVLMRQWGCEIRDVGKGEDAIAAVQDGWIPEVIIADYRLPGNTTGVQVVNQLQTLLKQHPPVLMVSGEMLPENIRDIEDAGFPLLQKPLAPAKLMLFLKQSQRKIKSAKSGA